MDDLISRQAAIDALKNRWKKTRNYEGIGDDIAEECELYLKQVPSAQPGWIPCSERLPKPGVYVLVDGADIPGGYRFPLIDKICDDGEWLNCDGSEWSAVAWMSIPEPWKGERDG